MRKYALLFCALCLPAPLSAQGIDTWLSRRIEERVAVRLAAFDPAREMQVPAGVISEANLVDRSRMPDVAGITLKLPTAATATGSEGTAGSFSFTPYIVQGLFGGNPLDPARYLPADKMRRLGLNVTFDSDTSGNRTTDVQAKFVILERPNPLGRGLRSLASATQQFGTLSDSVAAILYTSYGSSTGLSRDDFDNTLVQNAAIEAALAAAGPEARELIDALIEDALSSFVALRREVAALADSVRSEPEFAVGLTYNEGGIEPERLGAMLIYDVAGGRYDFTLNAGYERAQETDLTPRRDLVEAAGQVLIRLVSQQPIQPRTATSLTLAGAAHYDLENGDGVVFKVQARLLLPIADGVNVPLSATWASETDLIEEDEIRGLVGFSFDLGKLLNPASN